MPRFKAGESRDQMVFFPEAINDYIPEGHLAKLVLSIVSILNINTIVSNCAVHVNRQSLFWES
ncbi:hypothetical protein SAMN04487931_10965 [Desulfobacula phenolica]|uniref:Uncharacterized protein n=1 Tax=Desulfobacula phenolica TaxID=90732 RepID=A0A1H2IPE0_9BACT|nr:hypothetical protein SAMN04487931_10965 [Desulfobacula phenolica]